MKEWSFNKIWRTHIGFGCLFFCAFLLLSSSSLAAFFCSVSDGLCCLSSWLLIHHIHMLYKSDSKYCLWLHSSLQWEIFRFFPLLQLSLFLHPCHIHWRSHDFLLATLMMTKLMAHHKFIGTNSLDWNRRDACQSSARRKGNNNKIKEKTENAIHKSNIRPFFISHSLSSHKICFYLYDCIDSVTVVVIVCVLFRFFFPLRLHLDAATAAKERTAKRRAKTEKRQRKIGQILICIMPCASAWSIQIQTMDKRWLYHL